ncbi:methyl-accepting chemotaxis protein [Jonesia denitrificans]|uniref:Methyl-accepting chemotaxis sensory transducer with Cache sensor n=1 Tax=Jonesia denitrificans (strain ATCC 14870 / DSM 20603 / BCRC 15368 / CIP 55.134 / JCM 11481 / NBRC 15587 / NCTC 10816 / Prevot 55134) TaxID=471856 RepID=C7R1C2_JONDD|nr:cache domain-containing protein [Jonesia denitrificans]ACV08337.1 methyl-accepting chemotaxis sensory transducer with Cache sensor [Jonesia denitrificans DSM 20603]ASE08002.1 HAMP domain-containing protein [Jonesia denitrificans]QXB42610.1 cache domain-containing protein [Jonesia denitrificans]SQH20317.1 Methyl-accepting chemotaxis protein 4 [Jonesia denitrificans]
MSRIGSLTIAKKLTVLLVLTALTLIALTLISVTVTRERIYTEREDATRAVVETAWGIVNSYGEQAKAGTLSQEEAQQQALAVLEGLRYSGEEYFWVNDMNPTMIMHPFKPELNGSDLSGNADPDGKLLFVDMVDVVSANGEGFVNYQWPKPGVDAPQPKVSYVKGYEPWGWIVGSGVYVDDVNAAVMRDGGLLMAAAAVLVALVGAVTLGVKRSIVRPINTVTAALRSSDVTTRLDVGASRTELDHLAHALNGMLDRTTDITTGVAQAAHGIDAAAAQLAQSSEEIARTAHDSATRTTQVTQMSHRVSEGISTVAAGAQQMGASIAEISRGANEVSAMASNAVASSQSVTTTVTELGESSAAINDVVRAITSIAEQTNLLALNATIEAARAGDAGKGFAVVASEVKDLAQETARATGDITSRVESIQAAVEKAAQNIADITQLVISINDHQTTIAGAVEEQTATTHEIVTSVTAISEASHNMTSALEAVSEATDLSTSEAERVRSAASQLLTTAGDLQASLSVFTTATHSSNQ